MTFEWYKQNFKLLEQVQKTSQKAPSIMGVGIIGKGAKRRRVVPPEEVEEESQLNSVVFQFVAEILTSIEEEEHKLTSANTVVSLVTEIFCEEHPDIDSFWPIPVGRGGHRTNLEKDLLLLKNIPKLVFPIIDVLSDDWRIFNRITFILRAKMNQLLAFWEASRFSEAISCPKELRESVSLITLFSKSGIIPDILAQTSLLYEFCTPYHVFLLLNSIWGYLHCHPPTAELVESKFQGLRKI